MTQRLRARICAFATLALACLCMFGAPSVARAAEGDYQIYPTPQAISYAQGEVKLEKKATTVVESGIDAETKARLDETLKLKGIEATASETVPQGKGTAVLVGVKGSKGAVDTYVDKLVKEKKLSYTDGLFDKTDAYLLAALPAQGDGPSKIIVLGKDTDAAFYGLTTLYQIFQQVEGDTLRAFTACDYADVITRGFIEGYYGNPWSTEDRVELMRWGGHYKLNAYFYAPKDDPKHNAKWRELYTDEELTSKIEPLAKAGNESKCRFVFALHPFMSNPITNANYAESVKTLKAKFTQVMDHGVRQIAILADDAANQGNDLYIKLCKEMTDWLHEQQKATNPDGTLKYPGLKDTLIFCPVNYMGQGESWYQQLPSNVQVINTGGRVWGKIDKNFASTFQRNSGVAPFMWINWPCSDNDKDALHMGGHNNFLGSDLKPGQVKGVVINPMQQSEPSKQGIFMNADFTWNLWESETHADEAWEKSFSYVDHNSPIATEGSNALRSLSNHMKRMYGGGLTWENGESAAIKDELNAFRSKLTADTVTVEDCDKMISIFEQIKNDAKVFRESAGTPAMLKQMEPWIATFDDLTRAAITELNAVKASISGDNNELITLFAEGTSAFDQANNHELWYINHYEKARVGKAYITPTVNALNDYVAEKATLAADPDAVVTKLVTNRTDTPVGSKDAVFDGDPTTGAEYRDPNKVAKGDYFGMTQTKPFDLDTVTFVQGSGKNFFDCSKVQYFKDGEWKDVPNAQEYTTSTVTVADLGLKQVEGVRLVAVRANKLDAWPTINEIMVNQEIETSSTFTGTVTLAKQESADTSKPLQNASDAKDNTEAWFTEKRAGEGKHDGTVKDAAVIVTFDTPKTIDAIVFKQGGNSSDVIDKGSAYWQGTDGAWHKAGDVTSDKNQTIKLSSPVEAKAIKVVNDCMGTEFLTGETLEHDNAPDAAPRHFELLGATGCQVIIADGLKGTDETLVPVRGGEYVQEAKIGHALMDADIVISLTHFKGHEQAGFGGCMKNLGMGGGSLAGKMEQHSSGKPSVDAERCVGCRACERICAHGAVSFAGTRERVLKNGQTVTTPVASIDHERCVGCGRCIGACNQDAIEADYDAAADVLNCKIAEYTKAIVQDRPQFHISLAIDISPNCDCHGENDTPIVPDLGMFASFDPVAIDQACIDMALKAPAMPDTELTEMRDKLEAAAVFPSAASTTIST